MSKRRYIGTRRPTSATYDRQLSFDQPPPPITLTEALEAFIQAKRAEGVRERTIEEYRRHVAYLTEFVGRHDVSLDEIKPDVIRQYIDYLLYRRRAYAGDMKRESDEQGLAPSTINIRLRTLRTMCRFWYREGYVSFNAMTNIKPVREDEQAEVQGLSHDELNRLLNYYDERQFSEWRDKTLIYLLIDTGLRITEATSLTIGQIDLRRNEITVASEVAKNRKFREVPVSRDVLKRLLALHAESSRYFGDTDRVFMNAYGEHYTASAFRKRLNRLKRKVGLEKLHPHQFRHTFARDYLLNGGDLFTLQKILDHADIKTTRKYIQMDTEHLHAQHAKFSPVRRYLRRG